MKQMKMITKSILLAAYMSPYLYTGAAQASTYDANPMSVEKKADGTKAHVSDASRSAVVISAVNKVAPPERGVGSLSKAEVKHQSPETNYQTVLSKIAGFDVISTGPGNLTTSNSTFTYEGFNSDQVGVNFDGIPIINIFRGGASGTAFDHGITPLAMGQFSGVSVYSGANTPSETGINALGGTIDYKPVLPTRKAYSTLTAGGGVYSGQGNNVSESVGVNSGALPYTGTMIYASYTHNPYRGYQDNVYSNSNDYYFSALQPYDQGMSQLSLIEVYNSENSQFPQDVPVALINKYGQGFQWPTNVANTGSRTQSDTTILGWKSVLNSHMLGRAKFFVTSGANNTISYANSAYRTGYDGYPLPTNLHNISATQQDVYNPVALFGSGFNGSQYQRYIDNYSSVGFTPSLVIAIPHNTVTVGGLLMKATDVSSEWFYGAPNVPTIDGYNAAWNERDSRTVEDVFLQDRISLLQHRLIVIPGVKYYAVNSSTVETTGYFYQYPGSVAKTFRFAEPSVGLSYLFNKKSDVYVHYGRVDKAPNITAFYSAIGSHPIPSAVETQPEYVDSLDAGIRYKARNIGVSAAYFRRAFQNKFSQYYNQATGQTFEYNVGSALYQGFTLGINGKLPWDFNAMANYSVTQAKYTSDFTGTNGTVTNGMHVGDVPIYTVHLGVGYKKGGFWGRLSDYVVGPQYVNNNAGTTTGTALSPYNITNLNLGYKWQIRGSYAQTVSVEFYADNLLNTKYIPYEYIQSSGGYALAQTGAPVFVGAQVSVKM